MSVSVKLSSPVPTFDEVAKRYGVSKRRQEAISDLAHQVIGKPKASVIVRSKRSPLTATKKIKAA